MDKLTAIKIKMPNGSYSDQILISALAENVRYDGTRSVKDILDLLDARIGSIIALEAGSTTGDAELMDLRIGANGKSNYASAGQAVRSNINKLQELILIQETAPGATSSDGTTSWNKLWINNGAAEEIEIPTKDEFDILLNTLTPVNVLTWQSGDFDVNGANHTNSKSIRSTNFIPDNIIGIMCSPSYKFCVWAWDKETGDHIGHLKEDGTFGQTSSYKYVTSFALDKILGYKYKVTFYNENSTTNIATNAGANCITYKDATDTTLSLEGVAADAAAVGNVIAPIYSAASAYNVGDYVNYNGTIYRCKTAIGSGGETWTVGHWEATSVSNEFKNVDQDVADLKSALDDNLLNLKQSFTPDNWWHGWQVGILNSDGSVTQSDSYIYGDYIPVQEGDILYAKYGTNLSTAYMKYCCAYDSSKNVVSGGGYDNSSKQSYTIPSGVSFVRITANYGNRDKLIIKNGSVPTEYTDYFEPYYEYFDDFITDETKSIIAEHDRTIETIKDEIVDVSDVVKTIYYGKASNFGIGLPILERGYLTIENHAVIVAGLTDNYMYTAMIPVSEGDVITTKAFKITSNEYEYNFVNKNIKSVIAYSNSTTIVEASSYTGVTTINSYTVPSGVTYVKLSIAAMYNTDNNVLLKIYLTGQKSDKVQARLIQNYYNDQVFRGDLTDSTAMLNPNNVIHDSIWTMTAKIGSNFSAVQIGDATYDNTSVKITVSYPYIKVYSDSGIWKIDICGYSDPTLAAAHNMTYTLGFTPSDSISILLKMERSLAIKQLIVISGTNQWSLEDESEYGDIIFNELWNAPAITVSGTLEDIAFGQSIMQLHSKVWVFGDSWLTNYDHRVGGQLEAIGSSGWLKSSIHGLKSLKAIDAVKTLIKMSTPQTIIWAIGMNDPDTDSATINSDWKNTVEELMQICDDNGVELVLYTVPSVPASQGTTTDTARPHFAKNAYIRATGHRYIDAEKAVGADNENGYWYSGYWKSETDHTHTSAEGAIAVAMQYCADCPEIMYLY